MKNIPRQINFSTYLNLLKKNPIPTLIGFLFTILPIFMMVIFSIAFSSINTDTPEIDYDLINQQGKELNAKITDIETQHNITINGVHPSIISYTYSIDGQDVNSNFKTLSERKIRNYEIGKVITIKELNGSSIIKDLKPYDFSTKFLLFMPLLFLIIGLPFLLYSIFKLRKEVNLYKYGRIAKGKIISMIPKAGLPISGIGQGIIVHYQYEPAQGKSIIGESFTTDFSILNDKKKDDFLPIFISDESEDKSCIIPKLESLRNNWGVDFE